MSDRPGARGAGGLQVSGGRGGIAVALDDLTVVAGTLREASDEVQAAAYAVHRLELWSVMALVGGFDVVAALARVEWRRSAAVGALRDLAHDLDSLAWRTRTVVSGYWLAEREADLTLALARRAAIGLTRSVQSGGRPFGLWHDGAAAPAQVSPVDVHSRVVIWDLASVMTSQSLLSGRPVVRVIEVPQPDGSAAWILQIPGTQAWDPRAGPIAHDLTADLRLMGHQDATLTRGALDALAQAQAQSGRLGRGDPVMVTGHSLGGIAAMSIAANRRAREDFHITHVVTAGSPVGHFVVPEAVTVLSLEHEGDVVPRADLAANPDRAHWTTVRRAVAGARMFGPGVGASEHAALTYRETARLATAAGADGSEPSLESWSASAAPFFRSERPSRERGTHNQHSQNQHSQNQHSQNQHKQHNQDQRIRDYRVSRVTQSRP